LKGKGQAKTAGLCWINIGDMASLTSKRLFVGYSSVNSFKSQHLADLKLVEQDLLNHFFTKKNERVMMPGWGCGVWEYLFEPIDSVREAIIYEAQRVIESDPRVQLRAINVTQLEHGLKIDMDLFYVPFNVVNSFSISFDNRSQQLA
jgi:phage baseplate assembly protein W